MLPSLGHDVSAEVVAIALVSRSQTLSQGKGGGGRGGRESGKVLYIELSQRLV